VFFVLSAFLDPREEWGISAAQDPRDHAGTIVRVKLDDARMESLELLHSGFEDTDALPFFQNLAFPRKDALRTGIQVRASGQTLSHNGPSHPFRLIDAHERYVSDVDISHNFLRPIYVSKIPNSTIAQPLRRAPVSADFGTFVRNLSLYF
jgi:hypothetical protein